MGDDRRRARPRHGVQDRLARTRQTSRSDLIRAKAAPRRGTTSAASQAAPAREGDCGSSGCRSTLVK
jgi:hypothetical protein